MTGDELDRLDDLELYNEAVEAIELAAWGENNGGDSASYEHAMAVMRESDRRHQEAGHHRLCRGSIYWRAYEFANAVHGGYEPRDLVCDGTCSAS